MKSLFTVLTLGLLSFGADPALGGPREQAHRLYKALTGVTPTQSEISSVEGMLRNGDKQGAAKWIIKSRSEFYNVVLKDFFTPWTNRDSTTIAPLNDMSLLLIGVVRDEIPFDKAFYEDIYYTADGTLLTNPNHSDRRLRGNWDKIHINTNGVDEVIYTPARGENRHFEQIENKGIKIADSDIIKRGSQSPVPHKIKSCSSWYLFNSRFW